MEALNDGAQHRESGGRGKAVVAQRGPAGLASASRPTWRFTAGIYKSPPKRPTSTGKSENGGRRSLRSLRQMVFLQARRVDLTKDSLLEQKRQERAVTRVLADSKVVASIALPINSRLRWSRPLGTMAKVWGWAASHKTTGGLTATQHGDVASRGPLSPNEAISSNFPTPCQCIYSSIYFPNESCSRKTVPKRWQPSRSASRRLQVPKRSTRGYCSARRSPRSLGASRRMAGRVLEVPRHTFW